MQNTYRLMNQLHSTSCLSARCQFYWIRFCYQYGFDLLGFWSRLYFFHWWRNTLNRSASYCHNRKVFLGNQYDLSWAYWSYVCLLYNTRRKKYIVFCLNTLLPVYASELAKVYDSIEFEYLYYLNNHWKTALSIFVETININWPLNEISEKNLCSVL